MRHIPLLENQPAEGWIKLAIKAMDDIENERNPIRRNKLIDKKARIWGQLKRWLLVLSYRKCWFSEAKDTFQDWDVEHYRPKKCAKDINGQKRDGYWWLCLDWKNLRICGRVGNTKKGTFFPVSPGYVATQDHRCVDDELPYLLDPIKKSDCVLLSFNKLGEAIPASGLGKWDNMRVTTSIKYYGLDFELLQIARLTVWETCEAQISEIQNLMLQQGDYPSIKRQTLIEEKMVQLIKLTERDQPFSSVAIVCLQKSGFDWAVRLSAEALASTTFLYHKNGNKPDN